MNWQSIKGWFDYQDWYSYLTDEAPPGAVLVEVGVWLGRSVCFLGEYARRENKGLKIFAVDSFAGGCDGLDVEARRMADDGKTLYDRFVENVGGCGLSGVITPVVGDSAGSADKFADGSCWSVFIDADHRSEFVTRDVRAWLPKVAPGGWLSGHDANRDSVMNPVYELLGKPNVELKSRGWVWAYRKPLV